MAGCRTCGAPLSWLESQGKNIPIDPATGNRHNCPNEPLRACRDCSSPVKWGTLEGRRTLVNADGQKHLCPVGPSSLSKPSGHHTSASKIQEHETCPAHYRFSSILKWGRDESDEMDAGKLCHAAVRLVIGQRAISKTMALPVEASELLAAVDLAVSRENWNAWVVTRAREVLERAAPHLDFSLVSVDEHAPLAEREFKLAAGEGILIGGALDLVEFPDESTGVIVDFKAGDHEIEDAGNAIQVGIYLAAARMIWPERQWAFVHNYLSLGYEHKPIPWTQAREDNAKALARALVKKTRERAGDENAWEGRFGTHCLRCTFSPRCPTFAQKMGESALVGRFDPKTPEQLAEAVYHYGPLANVVNAKVDEWRSALKEHAATVVKSESFTDDEGKTKTVGRALIGSYPVRLTTYVQAPEKKPRDGGLRTRLDVGDPVTQPPETGRQFASTPVEGIPLLEADSRSVCLEPANGKELVITTGNLTAPLEATHSEKPGERRAPEPGTSNGGGKIQTGEPGTSPSVAPSAGDAPSVSPSPPSKKRGRPRKEPPAENDPVSEALRALPPGESLF